MKPLLIITLLAVMFGCATAYQRVGFSGGFSETQLGENVFQVSFGRIRFSVCEAYHGNPKETICRSTTTRFPSSISSLSCSMNC